MASATQFNIWGNKGINGSQTIDKNQKTYVIAHGWLGGLKAPGTPDDWLQNMAQAIRQREPNANIIIADWHEQAGSQFPIPYIPSANDTYSVGEDVAKYLYTNGIDSDKTVLIGHSLGGQVVGAAGKAYKELTNGRLLSRIIGLDPAGPLFEIFFNPKYYLDSSDAQQVDIVHSTEYLGDTRPLGHTNIYLRRSDTSFFDIGYSRHSYPHKLLIDIIPGKKNIPGFDWDSKLGNKPPVTLILNQYNEIIETLYSNPLEQNRATPYQTISQIGSIAGSIGAEIASIYGDKDFASQLITQASSKTILSWLGDAASNEFGESVSPDVFALLSRTPGNLISTSVNFVDTYVARAFNEALDIKNPISQIGVDVITKSAINHYFSKSIVNFLGDEAAINYFGIPPLRDSNGNLLTTAGGQFKADIPNFNLENLILSSESSLGSFIGSQLYKKLIDWNVLSEQVHPKGSSIGASIGGLLGSYIPGVGTLFGTFLGTLLGNSIADIFGDKDYPRAGVGVEVDKKTGAFVVESPSALGVESPYAFDGGNKEIAEKMGLAAKETLNLITGMIGGRLVSSKLFWYGHYFKDLFYQEHTEAPGGSSLKGRVLFKNPEEAVQAGVIKQLQTVGIEGGNPYMKQVLAELGNPIKGDGYADVVIDYFANKASPSSLPEPYGSNGGVPKPSPANEFGLYSIEPVNPTVILGSPPIDPITSSNPQVNWLALPQGSSVTLGFKDETVIDRPGNDIFIRSFDPEDGADEQADVYVSANGTDFKFLGRVIENGRQGLDLASIQFADPVKAVKIVGVDNNGKSPGFDLISVEVSPNSMGLLPYAPTINKLVTDLEVAKAYSVHKVNPILYGEMMLNIPDRQVRENLLTNWVKISERAHELKLNTLSGDDDGEFLVSLAGNNKLNGGSGNDFLYGSGRDNILKAGLGNDIYELDPLVSGGSQIQDTGGVDTLKLDGITLSLLTPRVGLVGLQKDATNLLIDLNQDGVIDSKNDLNIVDFFNSSGGSGTGFIETISNLSGRDIINTNFI